MFRQPLPPIMGNQQANEGLNRIRRTLYMDPLVQ
jgi:hypothetical protein